MNNNESNSGFLRTTRSFPEEIHQLSVELNRAYVDIATNINNRVTGFFPLNRLAQSGEQWFINKAKLQNGYRQVYQWSDSELTISHGIKQPSFTNIVRLWGTFYDGTSWQTLPYVDVTNVTNQISVSLDVDNIVITKGATAPTCTNGLVVVEFIANP